MALTGLQATRYVYSLPEPSNMMNGHEVFKAARDGHNAGAVQSAFGGRMRALLCDAPTLLPAGSAVFARTVWIAALTLRHFEPSSL